MITWPTNAPGGYLYQSTNLVSPNWVPVSADPTITNLQNEVLLGAPTSGGAFYRLQSQ
jgi:hypothetical protein